MRPSTRILIEEVAARYGTNLTTLLSRRHPRRLLAARIEIAKALAARGYYGSQIGAVMNRDWTTVYFYLGRTANKPSPKSLELRPTTPKRRRRRRERLRYAGFDRSAHAPPLQEGSDERT